LYTTWAPRTLQSGTVHYSPNVSRGEPPPARSVSVALGLAFALGLAVLFVLTLLRDRPAPLPSGLVGLRFGMTETEIKAQFPDVKRESGELIRETLAFEQRARCRLDLGAEGRLESIRCQAPASSTAGLQDATGKALAVARSVYGKASHAAGGVWTWTGTESVLTIRADMPGNRVVIESRPTAP
jgi:hypothetical protein